TLLKFVLAILSGSLVILAEAWHSLTDVFTSLLVYFSVSPHPERVMREADLEREGRQGEATPGSGIDWKNISLEKWISFIIGIIILGAAWGVLYKIIYSTTEVISSPFLYGLCFIFFAVCSFVVSVFEVKMGKEHNSPALIADGLHSKADMVGSLIAGFTMISLQLGINQLGINIDKIGAFVIIVFVFSFALETFVNFWWSVHGKSGWKERIAMGLITAAFEPRTWNHFGRWIGRIINWDHLSIKIRTRLRRIIVSVLILGLLILILLNCLTMIGPSQQGIRERMGRVINRGESLEPGLHLKLPWPLEKVIKVDSRIIRSMNIGNITNPSSIALLWTKQHGTEESFLSAEDYFFYPYLKLHYQIKNIFDYTYSFHKSRTAETALGGLSDAEKLLNNATHRLITQIFTTKVFVDIVTTYREPMEEKIKEVIQKEMDRLKAGLEIITVNTIDVHPPVSIADSYEQVIAAMQEKEQRINQALGIYNSKIPEYQGYAAQALAEAEAYVSKKGDEATGEASRFLSRMEAIQACPSITMPMLYRKSIKETLVDQPIILVDPKAEVPEVWLKSGRPIFLESQF
ncbi:MAG: SPFH domain-containing protein, partial [Candidatus Euphemobacter frigidus]|nr:SPFH domain-containing protein [Candidatus Euphemobacter frigidus]